MKLQLKFIAFLLLLSTFSIAQDSLQTRKPPSRSDFWDDVYFGGNIGLQFGTSTFIEISPLAGYKFTEKFSAGIGITYQYYHYKDNFYDFETNVYGARVFSRYLFTDYLFGHVEYEYLSLEAFDFYPRRRVDVGSLLAGGGFMQRLGDNSAIVAMILYNFTESLYTPYQNPIIRIGVNFGL